jgi:hypothetical protein
VFSDRRFFDRVRVRNSTSRGRKQRQTADLGH